MTERDVALKVTAAQIRTITVALMFFIITERTMRHGDAPRADYRSYTAARGVERPAIASATMAVSTATTAARPTTDASGVPATNRGPPPRSGDWAITVQSSRVPPQRTRRFRQPLIRGRAAAR